jgi:hypothetical protein
VKLCIVRDARESYRVVLAERIVHQEVCYMLSFMPSIMRVDLRRLLPGGNPGRKDVAGSVLAAVGRAKQAVTESP